MRFLAEEEIQRRWNALIVRKWGNRRKADAADVVMMVLKLGSKCSIEECSLALREVARMYAKDVRQQLERVGMLLSMMDIRKQSRKVVAGKRNRNMLPMENEYVTAMCDFEADTEWNGDSLVFSSNEVCEERVEDGMGWKPKKRTIDMETELDLNDWHGRSAIRTRMKLDIDMRMFGGQDVFVINEMMRMMCARQVFEIEENEAPMLSSATLSSIEQVRNSSTLTVEQMRNSSTGLDASESDVDAESEWLSLLASGADFNSHVSEWSSKMKAKMFLKVLELSGEGIIRPVQENPYGRIVLERYWM
ncbi:hypothetical protein HK407_09g14500 [Ordospora pajunii]|uniref:uncharacterized protein n=1 Tax=Ordospora pajunii TaxID=3039483 RepID=UPI0029527A2B|nr:uncharacterized protein HK407_09g14500 [Ordospora pajunii]KAH9411032.1 hypothetical protein HK407_09g14500 [Ordospora pajunii]